MAAGKSSRTGGEDLKQFTLINGKMLLEFSLDVFQEHPRIDEIILVLPEPYLRKEDMLNYLFGKYPKLNRVLAGGRERYLSVWNAVQLFEGRKDANLLVHDAARPCVTPGLIDALLDALDHNRGAVPAIPVTDTLVRANRYRKVAGVLDRQGLYRAQTPQAFRADVLYAGYEALLADGAFTPTDESGVVSRYTPDVTIRLVPGDPGNFKVTVEEDLQRCPFALAGR